MRRAAVLVAVLVGLGGCGRANRSATDRPLRIWHWMTDREEAFTELAKRYTQQQGIPVRFELYAPSDLYIQKVRAAAQTNGLPDIFGVLGEMRDFASFIRAGHLLTLDAAMAKPVTPRGASWRSTFFPIALAMNTFDHHNPYGVPPGMYGVPLDVMNIQMFYNKRLLKELGLDPEHPPATWEEFLGVGALAKQHGVLGFVSGWAELWLIDCFATDYAIHVMGQKQVEATFKGKIPYTDPRWLEVLGVFEQLRASGLPAEGVVTMVNKRAEQLFANGRAVFAFNGTWGVNVYQGMNPDLDYGVMMPPPLRKDRTMVTWGGAGSSFMVNAKSPKQEAAVAFLQWLTAQPQQRFLLEATHNIPANELAAADLPPALAAFADDMHAVAHPRLFDVQERSTVIEAFDKGIQSILIGEESPLQVAQAVQDVKQREEARQTSLASSTARRP
ncbi:MAG: extracellular solute-binding protein [Candidatus Omnitrophica bacterium]|nr:extracellular solute-binding protein [Candidatus Omnitrophota bacterium]